MVNKTFAYIVSLSLFFIALPTFAQTSKGDSVMVSTTPHSSNLFINFIQKLSQQQKDSSTYPKIVSTAVIDMPQSNKSDSLLFSHYRQLYDTAKSGKKILEEDWKTLEQSDSTHNMADVRAENQPIFEWAAQQTKDWKPKYYLGLMHLQKQDTLQARAYFNQCGFAPRFAAFYLLRAQLFKENKEAVLQDLEKAESLDENNLHIGQALTRHYLKTGSYLLAENAAKNYYQKFSNDFMLGQCYAKALWLNENDTLCIDVLKTLKPTEGESFLEHKNLWYYAHLHHAIAKLKEKQYGKAHFYASQACIFPKSFVLDTLNNDCDQRLQTFIEAYILEKTNQTAEAEAQYQAVLMLQAQANRPSAFDYLGAYALKRQGRDIEAAYLMRRWCEEQPKNKGARWLLLQIEPKDDIINVLSVKDDKFRLIRKLIEIL